MRTCEARECEVIGVLDPLRDLFVWHRAIQRDGVPVTFVEVIPGSDSRVFLAQGYREPRVAFQTDAGISKDGENLAPDFEHQRAFTERIALRGAG